MNKSPIASLLSARIGQGVRIDRTPLTVFPLFWDQRPSRDTVLAASAISSGTVVVTELPGGASVPMLSVQNSGNRPVLITQGTVLSGGRQDRVVNESAMVDSGQEMQISVSCVQHGRWHYADGEQNFRVGDSMVSVATRYAAGSTVFGDLNAQGTVWASVSQIHSSLGVHSESQQFSAVFDRRGADIECFVRKLAYVPGAYGVAIALGRKVVLIDVFADAVTCEQMWPQIVRGAATDALGSRYLEGSPRIRDVAFKIRVMTDYEWQGAAQRQQTMSWSHRFGTNQCSLLTFEKDLLHLSCVRQNAV